MMYSFFQSPLSFSDGVTIGILIIVAILVCYLLVMRKRTNLSLSNTNGDIIISHQALLHFIRSTLQEFSHITVKKIKIYPQKNDYTIWISCQLHEDVNAFSDMSQAMEEAVINGIREKLGVKQSIKVRFYIQNIMLDR